MRWQARRRLVEIKRGLETRVDGDPHPNVQHEVDGQDKLHDGHVQKKIQDSTRTTTLQTFLHILCDIFVRYLKNVSECGRVRGALQ